MNEQFQAVLEAWLNAPQRSPDAIQMNSSTMTMKCSVLSCAVGWAPSAYTHRTTSASVQVEGYSPVCWPVWLLRLRGRSQQTLSVFPVAGAAQASDNLAVVLLQHHNTFDFCIL